MIIDFHVHTFPDSIAPKTIRMLSMRSHTLPNTDGTVAGLRSSMEEAGIDIAVDLPVITNPASTRKINDSYIRMNEEFDGKGVLAFGGIHPDTENPREEILRLHRAGMKGIKIHPDYQDTFFDDIRYLRIMDAAAEMDMIILTHAGTDIGLPDPVHCTPKHVLHVLEQIQPGRLVLAHMGGWQMADEVEKYLCQAPVYFDTAYSLGSAFPPPEDESVRGEICLMEEEKFLRIVKKHGADKILFATDSPWAGQKNCREIFERLPLPLEEKTQILGENGRKLLGL